MRREGPKPAAQRTTTYNGMTKEAAVNFTVNMKLC